jgi:CP family cyanate transporter-like MFS transporter
VGTVARSADDLVKLAPATVLVLAWIAAFNLRSGFIGLGPVLPGLTSDLALTYAQASFLVAVPTLLMGLMAVPGGWLADNVGPAWVISGGLALVAIGGGLRAEAPSFPVLLALTILFGAGIGISQPSLPRLMRTWFPQRLGVTTGVYASGMGAGGIVGVLLSSLLVARIEGENAWREPIALWGIVAGVALVVWILMMRPWQYATVAVDKSKQASGRIEHPVWSPWRDRQTWIAAALFAAQGLVYYLLVAWLPAIYGEAGATGAATAGMVTVFNAATLPVMLLAPTWSDRLQRRRPPTLLAALSLLVGVFGLLTLPLADPWRWLWPACAGIGVAGLFAMALVLPADIAPRGHTGIAAGMVLGIGYVASALGPVIAGVGHDLTGSFTAILTLLPIMAVINIVLALIMPELPRRGTEAT